MRAARALIGLVSMAALVGAAPAPKASGGASTCGGGSCSKAKGSCGAAGGSSCSKAKGSCGAAAGGSSCSKPGGCGMDTDQLIAKLRSMPESFWDDVFRERDKNPLPPSEPFGPRPPSEPSAYAAALSQLLAKPTAELFEFARYKGELPVENLGAEAKMGGASMRMASLSIAEPIDAVHETFRQSFEAKGVPAMGNQISENSAYFAFRASDGFMRTMTLVEIEGETVVIAAVGDPAQVKQRSGRGFLPDWPSMPLDGEPVDLEQVEGGSAQLSRQALVIAASPAEVLRFHKDKLGALGWKVEKGTEVSRGELRAATFARGEERCTVSAAPAEAGRVHMAAMCMVRR